MATDVKLEGLDRAWVKRCIATQRAALVRQRAKEIEGSDIDVLRGKEIQQLDALAAKF